MRLRLALATVIALALLAPTAALAASTRYYVALGDSLSVGQQPRADGVTVNSHQGYVDAIFKRERHRFRGLRLVKLGCGGERASTMVSESAACFYPGNGSQLGAAVRFLRAHRGQIAFVTIDIGANDVQSCARNGTIDLTCISTGIASIRTNLPTIARKLRAAAGRRTPIVGMTYYDPILQSWLTGSNGQNVARASVSLATQVNGLIASDYRARQIRVADVATAFQTSDFTDMTTLPGFGQVPVNVANICNLTWMCSGPPINTNIHAKPAGYQLIARTFLAHLPH